MKQKSFSLLRLSRLMMFILLSFCYFIEIPNDQFGKQLFVIIALLLFVFSHFMMTTEWGRKYSLILTSSDFILSSLFGLIFLGEGTLYLIFFGIVSVTLLLHTEDKRILYAFAASFMVVWMTIMYLEDFINLWGHIISFSFVIFTTIVGSLINKLEKAQQQSHSQLEQLHFSHEALQQAHDQLREYSLKVEELTVYRERNRIARDIHDTVGHKMTALLVQLQLAREFLNLDIEKSKTTIETCESLTRETLQEIRLSVRTIHVDDENYGSFVFIIQKLLRDFSKMTNMKTTFTVTGDPTHIPTTLQPAMIRLIQEAITNAKRHGTAEVCNIRINCSDDHINIQIEDNGIGISKVTPGFGLINMKERAEEHGGFVTFQSEEEKGFSVTARFPLKQMKWSV